MNNHALILNGVILTQLETQLYYEILVLFPGKVISNKGWMYWPGSTSSRPFLVIFCRMINALFHYSAPKCSGIIHSHLQKINKFQYKPTRNLKQPMNNNNKKSKINRILLGIGNI